MEFFHDARRIRDEPTDVKKSPYWLLVRVGCEQAALPFPEAEYTFHPKRKWRFDWAWVKQRVALEIDGGVWVQGRHARGSGLVKEHEKMNAAAALGWRIFRCTPQNVGNLALYAQLKEAL